MIGDERMKFEITDWELGGAVKEVEAPGIAEAMLEYLPWPSLDIEVAYAPNHGMAVVVDKQTDFRYYVQAK